MSSPPAVLLGSQKPRLSSVPRFISSAGRDAVALAQVAGLELDPWQRLVLDGALGERSDGTWSAFEVGVVVPRQNGKGAVLEARELAGLFLFGEELILHTAHELKTSKEAFRRIKRLIEQTPSLLRRVDRFNHTNGEEAIELKSGQRLRFLARSKASGRGFTGDCVILDEAMYLPDEVMGALLPTLSARPNPQIWYAASAGMAGSDQLRSIRERGMAGGDESLAYFEWSAHPDADLDDPAAWADANPALGIRISEDFVRRERQALPDEEFGRERGGIWDTPSGAAVIPDQVWAAQHDPSSTAVGPVAVAFDVSPDQGHASIAWAGRRPDGAWHLEVYDNRPGDTWIVDELVELASRWDGVCAIACDPRSPAGALIAPLAARGVEVDKITTQELTQACSQLYSTVTGQTAWHLGQPVLTTAVEGARKRTVGDAGWAWHRKDTSIDITPLVAVTVAQFAHARAIAAGWTGEEPEPFAFFA